MGHCILLSGLNSHKNDYVASSIAPHMWKFWTRSVFVRVAYDVTKSTESICIRLIMEKNLWKDSIKKKLRLFNNARVELPLLQLLLEPFGWLEGGESVFPGPLNRQQPSPLLYTIDIWPARPQLQANTAWNESLHNSLLKRVSLALPC